MRAHWTDAALLVGIIRRAADPLESSECHCIAADSSNPHRAESYVLIRSLDRVLVQPRFVLVHFCFSRFLGEAASHKIEFKRCTAPKAIALWSAYFGLPTLVGCTVT